MILSPFPPFLSTRLRVKSLESAASFYSGILGFAFIRSGSTACISGSGGRPFLTLVESPQVPPRVPSSAGLFHLAVLFPDRISLAEVLTRVVTQKWPIEGMSDHGVSEAIYLSDPEGNGIELYCDRARSRWPLKERRLAMVSLPLDVDSLLAELPPHPSSLAPTATSLGHIHLSVISLENSESFYREKLGFDLMQHIPGAAFLSRGGYHHHLGLNTWGRATTPLAKETLGLIDVTIGKQDENAPTFAVDPNGIPIYFAASAPS